MSSSKTFASFSISFVNNCLFSCGFILHCQLLIIFSVSMNPTKCFVTLFSLSLVVAAPQGILEDDDELVDYEDYQQDQSAVKGDNYVLQYVGPRQSPERLFKVMSLNKGASRGLSQGDRQHLSPTQGSPKDIDSTFGSLSDDRSSISNGVKTPKMSSRNKTRPVSFKGGCMEKPPRPANAANLRCAPNSGTCDIKCLKNYIFPDKTKQTQIRCEEPGVWKVGNSEKIPDCEPICMPPCQNLGFCTAPDECSCPDNYEGPQCQFSKTKPCLDKPPTPMNSQIICNGTDCLLTCNNGFEFPSGSKEIKMVCVSGYWTLCQQLTGKFQKVPDCQPVCDPPCENGGRCLLNNVCECPQGFRGPQCNYPVENCAPERMNFNGFSNCSCGSSSLSCCVLCSLNCGADGVFEYPPASVYSCEYAEAKFVPENIPQCIFDNKRTQYFKSNSTSHSQLVIMQTSDLEWTGKETSNQETDFSVVSNGFQGFLGFFPKSRALNNEHDNFKATRNLIARPMPCRTGEDSNWFQKKYASSKSNQPCQN